MTLSTRETWQPGTGGFGNGSWLFRHERILRPRGRAGVDRDDPSGRRAWRCKFLDTAESYGPFTNEELLGRALEGLRTRW